MDRIFRFLLHFIQSERRVAGPYLISNQPQLAMVPMKKSIPSSFLVSLLLGVINTLPAGVVYTLKTTEFLDTKSSGTMTVFIEGKNLKMEIKDQGSSNTTILFKGEDNSMTMVDH